MGWARYAHSMRIFVFNSGLFYLRPTPAAQALLDKLILRVETENGWDQALFNECIFFPNSPSNKVGGGAGRGRRMGLPMQRCRRAAAAAAARAAVPAHVAHALHPPTRPTHPPCTPPHPHPARCRTRR